MAERRRGRKRADHGADQGQGAQNRERGPERQRPDNGGIRRRDPEDQDRNGQRQDQDGHNESAPAKRHGQGGPHRADEGERGCPDQERQDDRAYAARLEIEEQSQYGRGDDQRQAGGEPVRERLDADGQFQRDVAHQDQVERAVLVIGRKQAIEREQAREQRAEPKDRRADAPQEGKIGTERKGNERHDDQEEQHADRRSSAQAYRQ